MNVKKMTPAKWLPRAQPLTVGARARLQRLRVVRRPQAFHQRLSRAAVQRHCHALVVVHARPLRVRDAVERRLHSLPRAPQLVVLQARRVQRQRRHQAAVHRAQRVQRATLQAARHRRAKRHGILRNLRARQAQHAANLHRNGRLPLHHRCLPGVRTGKMTHPSTDARCNGPKINAKNAHKSFFFYFLLVNLRRVLRASADTGLPDGMTKRVPMVAVVGNPPAA